MDKQDNAPNKTLLLAQVVDAARNQVNGSICNCTCKACLDVEEAIRELEEEERPPTPEQRIAQLEEEVRKLKAQPHVSVAPGRGIFEPNKITTTWPNSSSQPWMKNTTAGGPVDV